jgi:uncharacterized membrane protein
MTTEDRQAAEVWQQAIDFVHNQSTSSGIQPLYIIGGFLGTWVIMAILAIPAIIHYLF